MNFIIKIGNFVSNLFKSAKPIAETAVKAIQILKIATDSPYIQHLAQLTGTTTDLDVLTASRTYLPKIAVEMGYVAQGNSDQIIMDLISAIQKKNSDQKTLDWINLAANLYRAMSDGKISISEAIAITQDTYRAVK